MSLHEARACYTEWNKVEEKDKYCKLMPTYEICKHAPDESIWRAAVESMNIEKRLVFQ